MRRSAPQIYIPLVPLAVTVVEPLASHGAKLIADPLDATDAEHRYQPLPTEVMVPVPDETVPFDKLKYTDAAAELFGTLKFRKLIPAALA